MPSYELVLILNPEIADDEVSSVITKITELVGRIGGNVDEVNHWGKRKLAYPIKRFMEGNYVLARLKLKPALARELDANLRLSGDILRHLLIRLAD